jgi:IS5 family transposase
LGVTDLETVELITESPYLQFLIGLSGFQYLKPFDPSMLVHFTKRIGPDLIKVCNDMTKANGIAMIQELLASSQEEKTDADQKELEAIETELGGPPTTLELGSNWGTLILDAKCVPDDIPYPVDLRLLNVGEVLSAVVAREVTEATIDELLKQLQGKIDRKSRCKRDKARNFFLAISKNKKTKKDEIQEAKRFQLHEIKRYLTAIDSIIHYGAVLLALGTQLYRNLLISSELYRQQQEM